MDKAEAKKQLDVLMAEAKKLQAIIDKPEKALHLEKSYADSLFVEYDNNVIGIIAGTGECSFLSSNRWIETYEQWRADGMPICSDVVEWRGKEYQISEAGFLHSGAPFGSGGGIYNFKDCNAISQCTDGNVKRHKHNNKPILF